LSGFSWNFPHSFTPHCQPFGSSFKGDRFPFGVQLPQKKTPGLHLRVQTPSFFVVIETVRRALRRFAQLPSNNLDVAWLQFRTTAKDDGTPAW
jgi:hypothetical protein